MGSAVHAPRAAASRRGGTDRRSDSHGRVASQSGPQTSEQRSESEEAEQTNAVLATGDLEIIQAYLNARASDDPDAILAFWEKYGDVVWARPGRLYPPETWLEGSDAACRSYFEGSTSECPGPSSATRDALTHDVVESHAGSIHFKNANSDVEKAIIVYGWAYLCENTDLLNWVLCWLSGPEVGGGYYQDVKGRLTANWPFRVNVKFIDDPSQVDQEETEARATGGFLGSGIIHWNRETYLWKYAKQIWSSGCGAMQTCLHIEIASILFHELLHVAGFRHATEDYQFTCDFAVLAGNCLKYAMRLRYPSACESSCCGCDVTTDELADTRTEWGLDFTNELTWSTYCGENCK